MRNHINSELKVIQVYYKSNFIYQIKSLPIFSFFYVFTIITTNLLSKIYFKLKLFFDENNFCACKQTHMHLNDGVVYSYF